MSRGTFGSQICDSFWRKLITLFDVAAKNEIIQEGPSVCRCESDEANCAANIFTQLPAVEQIKYPIVAVED